MEKLLVDGTDETTTMNASAANGTLLYDNISNLVQLEIKKETENTSVRDWSIPIVPDVKIEDKCYNTFNDGQTSIDYVLVYESKSMKNELLEDEDSNTDENKSHDEETHRARVNKQLWRRAYLKNLKQAGLIMEMDIVKSEKKIIKFVKLHIPWDVLAKYAEELSFRVPISIQSDDEVSYSEQFFKQFKLEKVVSPYVRHSKPTKFYTCLFKKSKVGKYIPSSRYPAYISNTQRQWAIYEILQSTEYGKIEKGEVGINRLLNDKVFINAYPLHDGDVQSTNVDDLNPRAVLYSTWAQYSNWYKNQPLELIRLYLGEKIGLYFAWLGAYTTWLILPAVVGLFVFLINLNLSFSDITTKEICTLGKNIRMCPPCNKCSYWNLSESCFQAQTSVLFDNSATLFYAIFMSFWAVSFLEYWKRKNVTLVYDWNCLDYEQEEEKPRAEFIIKADSTKRNPVTGHVEPAFSTSRRKMRMFAGFTTILFMMSLVIIFIFAVIMYKIFISIAIFEYQPLKKYASNISALSGAVINLLLILILGRVYEKLAYKLTEWEMHETQTEFENHLTFKVFIFQFVNFYSSIFYVAFVKGKFVGYPGNYTNFFGFRQEDCGSGGCLIELSQQLAIIMIGKQMINNMQEFILPKLKGQIQKFLIKFGNNANKTQMEKDLELADHDGLFEEYLEMVLQFGFITSFVAAFPLAPLFALLNNWIEIRLDAKKFICDTRRPLPKRASNIGIWFDIITCLVNIAVICNAFLIAFTSEFLPKLLYKLKNNWSLDGYTEFSLAYSPLGALDQNCRYRAYRDRQGNLTEFFWQLLVLRLLFVIVFEHLVFSVCTLIEVMVPDIPEGLQLKIKRERYLAKQALQDFL